MIKQGNKNNFSTYKSERRVYDRRHKVAEIYMKTKKLNKLIGLMARMMMNIETKEKKKGKKKCKAYWFGSMNAKETKDLHKIINLARNVRMTKQRFGEKKPRLLE
jgi:hypothetical protein